MDQTFEKGYFTKKSSVDITAEMFKLGYTPVDNKSDLTARLDFEIVIFVLAMIVLGMFAAAYILGYRGFMYGAFILEAFLFGLIFGREH